MPTLRELLEAQIARNALLAKQGGPAGGRPPGEMLAPPPGVSPFTSLSASGPKTIDHRQVEAPPYEAVEDPQLAKLVAYQQLAQEGKMPGATPGVVGLKDVLTAKHSDAGLHRTNELGKNRYMDASGSVWRRRSKRNARRHGNPFELVSRSSRLPG